MKGSVALVTGGALGAGVAMMPVSVLADDLLDLLKQGPSGEIRLRLDADEPARPVPPPGFGD